MLGSARDALAQRIETLASDASPEVVKTLAESFSLLAHGPQGGSYESGTQYAYTAHMKQDTDYHYTTHEDPRRPAGFSHPTREGAD